MWKSLAVALVDVSNDIWEILPPVSESTILL